jgi:hypothetical protein
MYTIGMRGELNGTVASRVALPDDDDILASKLLWSFATMSSFSPEYNRIMEAAYCLYSCP